MDSNDLIYKKLITVSKIFCLPGKFYSYDVITNGNINKTYKIMMENETADGKEYNSYIVQQINTNVFKKPEQIMANIELVTEHIKQKNTSDVSLNFYRTNDGKNFCFDDEGKFWRVMNYIDSLTYNTCDDLFVVRMTGEGFGAFQNQLSDLDGSKLYETIPNFHNTCARYDTLFEHAYAGGFRGAKVNLEGKNFTVVPERVAEVAPELEYLLSVRDKACKVSEKYNRGEYPVRVTHNDTKCNNILFDKKTKKPIAVIDLDTVMPGTAMYDFGDAARFITNTAAEDEPDLSLVHFDPDKFKALAEGFIGQVKSTLTKDELDSMYDGALGATAELAVRFLDDYIMGDTYFKVNYPGHNLVRARNQICETQDIIRQEKELREIIAGLCK